MIKETSWKHSPILIVTLDFLPLFVDISSNSACAVFRLLIVGKVAV